MDEKDAPEERKEIMARKKRKKTQARKRVSRQVPGTSIKGLARRGKLPTLGDLNVPEKGLLDPALRRDMGNIPGLAPSS